MTKKNMFLSAALTLVGAAVASGVAFAVKENGGIKPTVDKLKKHPALATMSRKLGDLSDRFGNDNDARDAEAA